MREREDPHRRRKPKKNGLSVTNMSCFSFIYLYTTYTSNKQIVSVPAARAVVRRVDGQPVARQRQWRVVNKAYEAEMICTVHKHNW